MNPEESIKQKLERYQRTQELTNQIRFNKTSTQLTTSIQRAINRNDMELVRSYIRTLSELDPANPYYSNLLKKDFISWSEFQKIVANFSANHDYFLRLQDKILDLQFAASRENETSEPPTVTQETEQPTASQDEEIQQEAPSQDQEESSSQEQGQKLPRREPPRRVVSQRPKPNKELTKEENEERKKQNKERRKERRENRSARRKASRQGRKQRARERKAREKFNNSRLGRGLTRANNVLNAPNRLSNRLGERFSNSRLGKNLAKLNSLLGAPGRFLNKFLSNLGNRFASRFLNNSFGRALGRFGRAFNALDKFLNPIDYYMDKLMGKLASRLGRLAWQGAKFAARLAMQAAKALANLASRVLSQLASQAAGGAARTAAGTVGRGALLILGNPFVWMVILVVGLFIIVMWFAGEADKASNIDCGKPGTVDILKTINNPKDSYRVGEKIEYQIIVVYNIRCVRAMADIEVADVLPANTTFASASSIVNKLPADPIFPEPVGSEAEAQGIYQGNTVTWKLRHMQPQRDAVLTLKITPKEEANNSWLVNEAKVNYTYYSPGIAPAVAATGGGFPPTQDNCGGKYTLADRFGTKNPLGNFGDPKCDTDKIKDELYTLLQQQDPANARFWYLQIIPCESSYNPNTWRDPSLLPKTPDPAGAWGLFQMGRGRNGPSDIGDVEWRQQTINAINYSKQIASLGSYWACARVDVQGADN